METIAVPFGDDAADRVKRRAADLGMPLGEFIAWAAEACSSEREAEFGAPLSPEQLASIRRGLEDVSAGRTLSQEEASAEVRERFGW